MAAMMTMVSMASKTEVHPLLAAGVQQRLALLGRQRLHLLQPRREVRARAFREAPGQSRRRHFSARHIFKRTLTHKN